MDQAEIVKSLLTNKNYAMIGPAVEVLKDWQKAVKALHKADKRILFDNDIMERLKSTISFGIGTVVNTYALFQVREALPKITNPQARAKAIEDMKASVTAKGGSMAASIESALDAFSFSS